MCAASRYVGEEKRALAGGEGKLFTQDYSVKWWNDGFIIFTPARIGVRAAIWSQWRAIIMKAVDQLASLTLMSQSHINAIKVWRVGVFIEVIHVFIHFVWAFKMLWLLSSDVMSYGQGYEADLYIDLHIPLWVCGFNGTSQLINETSRTSALTKIFVFLL